MDEKSQKKINAVDWSTLRGKFFHTFDDEGYVSHQGRIIDLIEEEIAIVGYFSWATGSPTTVHAVWVSDIVDDSWALYGTQEAMLDAYDIGLVRSKPVS